MKPYLLSIMMLVVMNCAGQQTSINEHHWAGIPWHDGWSWGNPQKSKTVYYAATFISDTIPNDTVCIKESSLRKLLTAAEQKKYLEQQVDLLNQRLQNQQDLTKQWKDKYTYDSISYSRERLLYDERNKASLEAVAQLNKQLRWQKLKGGLFGGGLAAAVVFIVIKNLK